MMFGVNNGPLSPGILYKKDNKEILNLSVLDRVSRAL